jgi:hypothetical protein
VAKAWYRDPRWNQRIEDEFERRLARARAHNRPQYLRIKGLTLLESGGASERPAARDLLQRVIDDYPDSLDVVWVHEALAGFYEEEGALVDAEAHWRAALRLSLEGNVHGDAQLRLPELLIRTEEDEKVADAEAILSTIDVQRDLAFKSQRFRYAVCRARLAIARDDSGEAAEYAAAALRETAVDTPDFPRHPHIGRVLADDDLLRELRRLAAAGT